MKTLLGLLVSSAILLASTSTAGAAKTTCADTVPFSGTKIVIVVLRGTSCSTARRVVKAYDKGIPPSPWHCGLAHAPFDKVHGRVVGFSCGYGSGPGNLRLRSHAFLGTIAK
jgi:hypothetical protein